VTFPGKQGESNYRLRRYGEISHSREVAEALGLKFVELVPSMIEKRSLGYVDRDLAFSLNCVPMKLRGERLMVAMADPSDCRKVEKLQLFSRCKILPVVATPSAIKNTLIQRFGTKHVPSGMDELEGSSLWWFRQKRKPRVVAMVSGVPSFSGTCLASNIVAVLNRAEKKVLIVDPLSENPVLPDSASGRAEEHCDLMILTPPMTGAADLDWAIRAEETFLLLSPSHWQEGCSYVEALFERFVEVQKNRRSAFGDGIAEQQVFDLSVVCAQLSSTQQGFKLFRGIETRAHHDLDMREPGFDLRLHYIGGILDDKKNIEKAGKAGIPLANFRPHSPAAMCMAHIAQSLLRPVQQRDPRININRSLVSRMFG
jgi:hypothetical protein